MKKKLVYILLTGILILVLCSCGKSDVLMGDQITISVDCKTLLDNMDLLDPEKVEMVPENGYILNNCSMYLEAGDTAFSVLQRACRENKIQMEFIETPIYNSVYIEGINNIYEFDAGSLSGWEYSVNGVYHQVGSSLIELKKGDTVMWRYTCDLGKDIEGEID